MCFVWAMQGHAGDFPDQYEEYLATMDWVKFFCNAKETKGAKIWTPHAKSSLTIAIYPLESGSQLCIKYGQNHGVLKIWIEFNPSKLSNDGFISLKTRLDQFFHHGGYSLLKYGAITRCELAIDIDGAKFHDYVFIDTKATSSNHDYEPDGTVYLGGEKSAVYWSIYDKMKHLQEKFGIYLGHDRLRIERVLQPSGKLQLGDLFSLDLFSSLLVIEKAALKGFEGHPGHQALTGPLSKLQKAPDLYHGGSKLTKAAIRDLASLSAPEWWKPKEIAMQLEDAFMWVHQLI